MDHKFKDVKDKPLSRNLLQYSKQNEMRKNQSSTILDSSLRKEESDYKILNGWNKSATVHSNIFPSQLGYTDSLVKSTAAGTMGDGVRITSL